MTEQRTSTPEPPHGLKFCLVSDDDVVEAAVRVCCPEPHRVESFPMTGLVDAQLGLSEQGRRIVSAAASAEAVLIAWDFDRAPVINTLCYHVRRTQATPVVALCRNSQEDLIAAIAAGADDAMTFPIYPPLLSARAFAYRRLVEAARTSGVPPLQETIPSTAALQPSVSRFGVLRLDRAAHRFYVRDEEVELTPREFALLDYLIRNADTLCTRDQILDHVWGINFDTGTNMVDVYMYFLRRKLEAHGIRGMIQTVRGHGYRLVLPAATTA